MQRHETIAETTTPEGGRMTLSRHAGDFYVEVDGQTLMSSRAPGSERELAKLAAKELSGRAAAQVLIGGLGLGYTLGAALTALPTDAQIRVVELSQAIVDWNRTYAFDPQAKLDDRRVTTEVADVVSVLQRSSKLDAILLDVDNGPGPWTLASNHRLYDTKALAGLRSSLKRGGVLAIWSAEGSPAFVRRMASAGFKARAERVRSRGNRGEHHTIFLGRA